MDAFRIWYASASSGSTGSPFGSRSTGAGGTGAAAGVAATFSTDPKLLRSASTAFLTETEQNTPLSRRAMAF